MIRFSQFIPPLLAAVLLCGTSHAVSQTTQLPSAAIALHREGKLPEAVTAYREFLIQHPKSLPAQSNLAVALANLGRLDEAITEYEKALALDTTSVPVRMNLSIAYYKQRRIPEAGRLLDALHSEQPENKQILLLYADCLLRLGEYSELTTNVEPFVEKHPEDMAANYLLGMAYVRANQPQRGQLYIDRIMKAGSEAESLYLVGASQYEAGDYPAARDTLARARKLNPELPGIHTYYAQALVETGDAEGAKASFQEALRRDSTDFEANLRYGAMLRVEKEVTEAAKYLAAAERLNAKSLPLQFQLASLHLETGETKEAVARLEQIVERSPTYLEAHISLARGYYRLKRKTEGDREREIIRELEATIQRNEVKPK